MSLTVKDIFNNAVKYQDIMGNEKFPRLDADFVSQSSLGIYTELGELLQAYKCWKPWHNSDDKTYDKEQTREELIDVFIFVVNLALSLNLTPNEFECAYNQKYDKLLKRCKK